MIYSFALRHVFGAPTVTISTQGCDCCVQPLTRLTPKLLNPKSCVLLICRMVKDEGLTCRGAHLCDRSVFLASGWILLIFLPGYFLIVGVWEWDVYLAWTRGSAVHPHNLWMLSWGFTEDLVQTERACGKVIHFVCLSGASRMGMTQRLWVSHDHSKSLFFIPD